VEPDLPVAIVGKHPFEDQEVLVPVEGVREAGGSFRPREGATR
jgi:hypothetical protein